MKKKRCVKPPLFQCLWGACKSGVWFCLFVSDNDMKDSCMSPQRQKLQRWAHLQRFAELFLQGCVFVHGYVVGSTRVLCLGSFCTVSLVPPLLPMWVFSRKLGFLPQFIDKHVSLTGGSLVFCKGVVTKLFWCLSPTDCWESLQHHAMTQHEMNGVKDGWTGGRTDKRMVDQVI